MSQAQTDDAAAPRTGSVLILRPSLHTAHNSLERWLAEHPEVSSIAVLRKDDVAHLDGGPGSRLVQATLLENISSLFHPLRAIWHGLLWLFQRYETVVILCPDSREAISGLTVFQILRQEPFGQAIIILSKVLSSDKVVLVGPGITQDFPGMYGLFEPKRVRGLIALVGAVAISLATTAVAIMVIAIQEALIQARLLR
ncbi:MAG: hypothetical protein ACJ8BW_25465 [Ktedonobacteraceae bacterium]